jgi:hypothetical protein
MFVDAETRLWNAVALTVGTAVSTNGYDTGADAVTSATRRDPSQGNPLVVVVTVGVTAVTSAAETYEFDVVQADNDALTSNKVVLAQYPFTNTQAAALLKAGAIIVLPIPQGSVTKRYLGAQAVLSGGASAITVTAWITSADMVQAVKYYGTLIQVL